MGSSCPHFRIGKLLASKANLSEAKIHTYIEFYNRYVRSLDNPGSIKPIDDAFYDSLSEEMKEKYIEVNAHRLSTFIHQSTTARIDNAETLEELRQEMGSKAATAQMLVLEVFPPEARESFRCEFAFLLRRMAAQYTSVGEMLDNNNIASILKSIKNNYTSWASYHRKRLITMQADPNTPENEIAAQEELVSEAENIVEYFAELCIVNNAEMKKLFGRSFNPESNTLFVEDDESNIHDDDEVDVNLEEEERERWQVIMDSIDPSGTLSSIINNVIAQCPVMTSRIVETKDATGNTVWVEEPMVHKYTRICKFKDTDGSYQSIPMTVNTRVEARRLLRTLNSCVTSQDMMAKLEENFRYSTIANYLRANPRMIATFFTNFNKYYLHYYSTETKGSNFSEIHLNASGNYSRVRSFFYNLSGDKSPITSNPTSVFTKKQGVTGVVPHKDNIMKFYKNFIFLVGGIKDSNIESFISDKTSNQQVHGLDILLRHLNIQISTGDLRTITSDSVVMHDLLSSLRTVISLLTGKSNSSDSALSLFDTTQQSGEKNAAYIALTKILEIAEMGDEFGSGLSGMVTYKGAKTKTLAANVMMSQMTRFIKECNNCSSEDLQQIITETYMGDSSLYNAETGRFRVRWLQDLMDSSKHKSAKTFRKRFKMSRNLGMDQIDFDRISDKGHMLSILSMYFNNLSTNNNVMFVNTMEEAEAMKDSHPNTYVYVRGSSDMIYIDKSNRVNPGERSRTIMVPTFITGDTLALRGITSLHYDLQEIISGMFDFYMADRISSRKADRFNEMGLPVSGNGKESFTKNADRYGFCGFLRDTYLGKVKVDGKWELKKGYWAEKFAEVADSFDEATMSPLIEQWLESEFEYFYEVQLPELGITDDIFNFDDKGVGEDRKAKLRDFYYNFRFSQLNQTALVDISPNFFTNAEEQQKRHKVALTNGTQLCIDAVDPKTSQPVWDNPKNPTQKVMYIYDIKPALSEHDFEMLKTIFGKDAAYNYAKVYEENTISDGQGWRNFDSWRKIGLSFDTKVWSDQMEDAYWKIKELSKDIYNLEEAYERWESEHKEFKMHSGNLEELQAEARATEGQKTGQRIKDMITSKIAEIESLAVVFQPRKPVCNGIEQYQGMAVPFQHKYAEIPIIPALFPKGSALRTLGRFMEEHNIDMFCSDKCGKKGVFGEIDVQYKVNEFGQYIDTDGNVLPGLDTKGNEVKNPTRGEQRRHPDFDNRKVENISSNGDVITLDDMLRRQVRFDESTGLAVNDDSQKVYNGVVHENPLRTYLIQTNVPDHSVADAIFGNQPRKIILGGMRAESTYTYKLGGREVILTGEQLMTLYNALISANLMRSYSEFERLISDDKRVLKELAKNIINNDRSDLSSIDRMARGLPFWDPLLQHDSFASIVSMFKNIVIKQKIHGGSVVQASGLGSNVSLKYLDEGLRFNIDEHGYPTECEAVMPFAFSVTDEFGDSYNLEFDEYCNPDGTFKVVEDGSSTLIEKDYPGILDIIAYRVPTEREYSILKLKVKRCCPKTGGNFIQLPAICTTRAGFDFDIDKLLLMRRVFNAAKTKYNVEEVWKKVYELHPNIQEALEKAKAVATPDDIEAIKQDFERRGEEVPEDKDIPLNRFWKVGVNRGYITEDKKKIFREAAEGNRDAVISEEFTELDAFDENGNINLEKIFSGNVSKSDVDNLLLDIIQARMADPETAQARFTAGGFENTTSDTNFIRLIQSIDSNDSRVDGHVRAVDLSNMAREDINRLKSIGNEEHLFDDPITSILFNQLNQAAANLIGVYANASSNYFIQSKVYRMKNNGPAILFGSHLTTEGSVVKPKYEDSGINMLVTHCAMGDMTVSQILAELLAASVDAVKNPVLKYLNLNMVTADAAAALVRMGYDTRDIGLLFNQPIIKEITSLMEREGINSVNTAMAKVLTAHKMPNIHKLVGKKGTSIDLTCLTREALAYNLTKDAPKGGYAFIHSQEQVIKVFYNLMKLKDSYTKKVQESRKTSGNATKTNVGSYKADMDRRESDTDNLITIEVHPDYNGPVVPLDAIDEVDTATMKSRLKYFSKYTHHPYAFEVVTTNLINKMFTELISNNTPYDQRTFLTIEDAAKRWCHYGTINADTYNELYSEIPKLIFKSLDGDLNPEHVNQDKSINPKGLTNFELYVVGLQDMIDNLNPDDRAIFDATTAFQKNIFKGKQIVIEDVGRHTVYELSPGFSITKEVKEDIYASWQSMSRQSEGLRQLAKAIFLHLYYQHGLQQSSSFDFRSVPMSVLSDTMVSSSHGMSYVEFMLDMIYENDEGNDARKVLDDNMINPYALMGEFIRQHSDNSRFIYRVNNAIREYFEISEDGESVTIGKDHANMLTHVVMDGMTKTTLAVPYINIDGQLYELVGFDGGTNRDSCKVAPKSSLMYTVVKSSVDSKYSTFISKDNVGRYIYGVADSAYNMSTFEDSYTEDVEYEGEERTGYEEALEVAEPDPNVC